MSAITRAYAWCDHGACPARVEDTDGNTPMWTKADARREARRRGWLTVHRGHGISDDYCPEHRAAHEPKKEVPGAAQTLAADLKRSLGTTEAPDAPH